MTPPNAPTASDGTAEELQREFRIEALLRDADLRARWLAYYTESRRRPFSSDSATLIMALDRACTALLAARRDSERVEWLEAHAWEQVGDRLVYSVSWPGSGGVRHAIDQNAAAMDEDRAND